MDEIQVRNFSNNPPTWESVTDSNRNVLPGQQITLRIECTDHTLTEIKWEISGKPFKDYVANKSSGTLTPLGTSDLNTKTVTFYWADTGDGKQVKLTFKIGTASCEKTATFNVKKPTSSLTAVIGITGISPNNQWVTILPPPPPAQPYSIYFTGTVAIPGGFGFPQGSWHWVQRVNATDLLKVVENNQTVCVKKGCAGTLVLDHTYPYQPPPLDPPGGSPPGAYATGATAQHTQDNPTTVFPPNALEVRGENQWEMHIMFKPGASNGAVSKWVPLRVLLWSWRYCCQRTNQNPPWILVQKGQTAGASSETSDHPKWTRNIDPAISPQCGFQPIACPPPCQPDP